MKLYLPILSRLLHLANRCTKQDEFYAIKDKILSKHSKLVGYDLQFLEGKKCFTCEGTGLYKHYYWESGETHVEADYCNRCNATGWYKHPRYVLLERKQFGKYTFHKPIRRWNSTKSFEDFVEDLQWQLDLPISPEPIEGYIERSYPKHGRTALTILYWLYNPRFWWMNYKKSAGLGWKCYWYLPRNWAHTIAHFIRHGRNAYPFRHRPVRKERNSIKHIKTDLSNDDLPF